MKRDQIRGFGSVYVTFAFFGGILIGIGLGITLAICAALYIRYGKVDLSMPSDLYPLNHALVFILIFIGVWLGVLEIGIPLFLLALKPFFTREAVDRFQWPGWMEAKEREARKEIPGFELFLVNRIGDYWFNLIFPPNRDLK